MANAEEFRALPSAERNQLALDRYLHSCKSHWQIGCDERYVGYLREQDGCRVAYRGIFKGLEDLGRGLLAEKGNSLEVIQCKRWSRAKVIHEKQSSFQLFGTMVATRIENLTQSVSGTFVTSISLSERAREFAHQLEIRVGESFPLGDYPRIKCNIGRTSGKRIYLPALNVFAPYKAT